MSIAKRRNNAERLRNSVYALPRHTAAAMLRGIRGNRIIVGGYVDKRGGVCPMLAAHRNGGRTNFGTFARAWDAFTGASRKPQRAARRDVRALEGYLEMALTRHGAEPQEDGSMDPDRSLAEEVREVQATRRHLAEIEAAEGADVTVGDVLATTYAAAKERRAEERAHDLYDTDEKVVSAPGMDEKVVAAPGMESSDGAGDEPDSAEAWAAALERADAEPA